MNSLQALNLIGGEWMPAHSSGWGTRHNPADGSALGRFAASGRSDADAAIDAARRAFNQPSWARNPRLRQMMMLRWADRLEARAEELACLLTLENGKVLAQSRGEIAGAVSEIRFYAGLTRYMPGHAFEVVGCRRVEFKTDALNERARGALAALPSEFEGIHRKHMLVRGGERRDSAWYAVIDDDWPAVKQALEDRLSG